MCRPPLAPDTRLDIGTEPPAPSTDREAEMFLATTTVEDFELPFGEAAR